ncbi:MAG TPA: SUKH-4 family immunity protein [Vicinamibacterales bacterium]|nr:SUKH-4 family immunity protein [Vicinamibacterales bacterium]
MTPHEFKKRYISSIPETPPELELGLDEFERVEQSELADRPLDPANTEWMSTVGFPRDAAPFLSFLRPRSQDTIHGIGEDFYLGHEGSGDAICIDRVNGSIVQYDHERMMRKTFVNSSLRQFAECLCIYQEHSRGSALNGCWEAMCAIDHVLIEMRGFWWNEIQNELGTRQSSAS